MSWLVERWRGEGRAVRTGWALVLLLLLVGLIGPVAIRRASPAFACQAAWGWSRAAYPKQTPAAALGSAASSDGTFWISSASPPASREAPGGRDPWGNPWLYEVVPIEQDAQWRHLTGWYADQVGAGAEPRAQYARGLHQWARLAGGFALLPYSTGPDGVDQGGAGDDIRMRPLLGSRSQVQDLAGHLRPGALGAAALLAWGLLAWSLGRRRWPTGGEALVAGLLALLPAAATVAACLENALTIRRQPLVRAWAERPLLRPDLALAASVALVVYLALLTWRLRRARAAAD